MDESDFYSANPLAAGLRLILKRPSLYSNQRFYRLVRAEVLPQLKCFGDIDQVKLCLSCSKGARRPI
jgi:hypothetical protein